MTTKFNKNIDKNMSYKLSDLKNCILKTLGTDTGFNENLGLYETTKTMFKGLITLDSINEVIKKMKKIYGNEQKYFEINGQKTLWTMGNPEETFRGIGHTIQLPEELGPMVPRIKTEIVKQIAFRTMKPNEFLNKMIDLAKFFKLLRQVLKSHWNLSKSQK